MSPARITYHALNVLVCIVLGAALLAMQHGHRTNWPALVFFIALVFDGSASMNALRRDKP